MACQPTTIISEVNFVLPSSRINSLLPFLLRPTPRPFLLFVACWFLGNSWKYINWWMLLLKRQGGTIPLSNKPIFYHNQDLVEVAAVFVTGGESVGSNPHTNTYCDGKPDKLNPCFIIRERLAQMPVRCIGWKKNHTFLTQLLKTPSHSTTHRQAWWHEQTLWNPPCFHENMYCRKNMNVFQKCTEDVWNLNHRNIYLVVSISSCLCWSCLVLPKTYRIIP